MTTEAQSTLQQQSFVRRFAWIGAVAGVGQWRDLWGDDGHPRHVTDGR